MKTVRASALNMAAKCPGFLTLPSTESPAMADGTAKHEALAAYFSGLNKKRGRPRKPAPEWRNWIEEKITWLKDALPEIFERENAVEVAAEHVFGNGEYVLSGHIDLVSHEKTLSDYGRRIVIDWKTGAGWLLPPIGEDLQMLAYAVLAEASVIYRIQIDNERIDVLELNDDNLRYAEKMIEVVVADVCSRDEFVVGAHCESCRAKTNCNTFLGTSDAIMARPWNGESLVLAEQATRALYGWMAGKELLKQLETILKKYAEEAGGIMANGKIWSRGESFERKSNISEERLISLAEEVLSKDESAKLLAHLKSAGEFATTTCDGGYRFRKAVQ